MKKLILAAGAATVLSLGAFTVPTVANAQPVINVQIGPPPPPRAERVPPPRRGYVWAPGHWEPRGKRHVWVAGKHLLDNRRLTRMDEQALCEIAKAWGKRIAGHTE